jgi:hypothetical protein
MRFGVEPASGVLMGDHTRDHAGRTPSNHIEPSKNPLDRPISLYRGVRGKAPSAEYALREFLAHIRDGKWKRQVLAVRALYSEKEAYKAAKSKLPWVVF